MELAPHAARTLSPSPLLPPSGIQPATTAHTTSAWVCRGTDDSTSLPGRTKCCNGRGRGHFDSIQFIVQERYTDYRRLPLLGGGARPCCVLAARRSPSANNESCLMSEWNRA